jgi:WD40 repeat protein
VTWALSVSPDQSQFVTGGADSQIQLWEDSTAEEQEQLFKEKEEKVLKEQELSNSISKKDYHKVRVLHYVMLN